MEASPSERRGGERMMIALAFALAAGLGLVTVDGGFVYDDLRAIVQNPVVTGEVPALQAQRCTDRHASFGHLLAIHV